VLHESLKAKYFLYTCNHPAWEQ